MRAMSGMNPAFIAQQLGHRVQRLLSTHACWLYANSDRAREENASKCPNNGPSAKCAARNPLIGKAIDLHS
jgi:integrase